MKLKIRAPITIGKTSYSTREMVRFVTKNDRRYNVTADAARMGLRTAAAFDADGDPDLDESDLRLLGEVVEKPSCGWGVFEVERAVPTPDGKGQVIKQRVQVSTAEFLPLIDPISDAAKSLPALKK